MDNRNKPDRMVSQRALDDAAEMGRSIVNEAMEGERVSQAGRAILEEEADREIERGNVKEMSTEARLAALEQQNSELRVMLQGLNPAQAGARAKEEMAERLQRARLAGLVAKGGTLTVLI